MRKILISIPFVILVALDMLFIIEYSEPIYGALGILHFPNVNPVTEFVGLLCFPIIPSLLATFFYAKVVTKNHGNVSALGFWTLFITGIIFILVYLPDPLMESFFPELFRVLLQADSSRLHPG